MNYTSAFLAFILLFASGLWVWSGRVLFEGPRDPGMVSGSLGSVDDPLEVPEEK